MGLSLRWLAHHSALDAAYGDGIILGASRKEQLEECLDVLKCGELSAEEQEGMEEVWRLVGEDAPGYAS